GAGRIGHTHNKPLSFATARKRMIVNWHEPTLEDILSDSIIKAVMKADGVDPHQLAAMLLAWSPAPRSPSGNRRCQPDRPGRPRSPRSADRSRPARSR